MYKIPLSATPIDSSAIAEVLRSYEGQPVIKIVEDFEVALAKYLGAGFALALNSGTSAIHLGLKLLGVKPGDSVIAPTFTYVATVGPILYLGATPILVDSERTTWNISPELTLEAIRRSLDQRVKPACVVAVHSYGMPAQMTELQAICNEYEIPLLEDAAEAVGSSYHGKLAGTIGDIGVLSFNNNKVLTTYGGGALITNSEQAYRKALFWATQSKEDKPYYEHTTLGFNYRMSPLAAAAGLHGLMQVTNRINERYAIFAKYRESLPWLDTLFEPEGLNSNRWLSAFLIPNTLKISQIISSMSEAGIECRRFWNPMHLQPYYKKYPSFINGFSEELFGTGLCLPSSEVGIVHKVSSELSKVFAARLPT
jgi:dTDP-4-amino-4,6-dideoxygalactose transaminase